MRRPSMRFASRALAVVSLASVALWSGACGGAGGEGGPGVTPLEALASQGVLCCDPIGPFPQVVGTVTFTNPNADEPLRFDFAEDVGLATLELAGTVPSLYADPSSGVVPPGGTVTVNVVVTECLSGARTLVCDQGTESRILATHRIVVLDPSQWFFAQAISEFVALLAPLGAGFLPLSKGLATDPSGVATLHSAVSVPPKVAGDAFTQIRLRGVLRQYLEYLTLVALFGDQLVGTNGQATPPSFPCGAGPNGFTVCPNPALLLREGDHVVAWLATEGTIPLADPSRSLQYGFVFDADGNTANNYVPAAAFANDFYRGTDRWYSVEYTPATGWRLIVTDARNNAFTPIPSAARAVIADDTIALLVPASEFSVPDPAYRVTAFSHYGDFGIPSPNVWSGDLSPTVAQGLAPFPEGP